MRFSLQAIKQLGQCNSICLVIVFCFVSVRLHSQNNNSYWDKISNSKLLKDEKNIQGSLHVLQEAKEIIKDPKQFSFHYDFLEYYASINDTVQVIKYIKENSQDFDSSFIMWYNKHYIKMVGILLEAKYNVISELDSLIFLMEKEDQSIRSLDLGDDYLSKNMMMNYIDSLNFFRLTYILHKYGFPNKYSYRYSCDLNSVLIHIRNYERFAAIDQYLRDAIEKGDLTPYFYAWAFDESYKEKYNRPFYYYTVSSPPFLFINELSKDDIHIIDKRRHSIHLPSFPILLY